MNFDISDDQKQLRDEARKFLTEKCPPKAVRAVLDGKADYDRDLWKGLAEMGFLGVAIPEEFGGAGAGHLELCVLAEEMGRALAPVPFSSTVYLAAETLMIAGSEAQKQKWLPKIASGEAIGTLALFEGPGNPSHKAIKLTAANNMLNGVKKPVADGAIADFAIVAARTGSSGRESDIALYLADRKAGGVEAKVLTGIDPTRQQAELTFKNCKAEPLGDGRDGWGILTRVLDRAAVLTAFEQVGGSDRALEMGRDYALDRIASVARSARSRRSSTCWRTCMCRRRWRAPIAITARGRSRPMPANWAKQRRPHGLAPPRRSSTAPRTTSRYTAAWVLPGSSTATCTTAAPMRWRSASAVCRIGKTS
jgi:alkylation response protein AidB-like acyl-CoA dehydrogenase